MMSTARTFLWSALVLAMRLVAGWPKQGQQCFQSESRASFL